ncbi:hypothetical protein QBC43DRAFT_339502 [Cladorrhinum sp. PSN259]|nr:hypothetical protein QBC43DRAFT_339502 [Cladorrhinum sp. PSN259]
MALLLFLLAVLLQLAAGLPATPVSAVVATAASGQSAGGVTCSPLPYLNKPDECHPRTCAYGKYGACNGELCNNDYHQAVMVDQNDLAFQITVNLYDRCIISHHYGNWTTDNPLVWFQFWGYS